MKYCISLAVYLIFGVNLIAQDLRTDQSVDISIEKSVVENMTVFKAVLTNKKTILQNYRYEFITINRSQGGNNTTRQKGKITAEPNKAIILSTSKIGLSKELIYDVRLFVYQEDDLIKSTLLSSHNKKQANIAKVQKQDDVNSSHEESQLHLGGLILDETRTRAGRDFYELFYKKWQSLNVDTNFNIGIKEIFVRGRNTRLSILVNEQVVFVSGLQPRYDVIESRVNAAIPRVNAYIKRQKKVNKDLKNGDESGGGIF